MTHHALPGATEMDSTGTRELVTIRDWNGNPFQIDAESLVDQLARKADELFPKDMELLSSSHRAVQRIAALASGLKSEHFGVIFLNVRNRIIAIEPRLFSGSVDRANVYPRVVLQHFLNYNAAGVILFHNHPSGIPEPSPSDVRLTGLIDQLLGHLEGKVLDHVVVAGGTGVSMAERGMMPQTNRQPKGYELDTDT